MTGSGTDAVSKKQGEAAELDLFDSILGWTATVCITAVAALALKCFRPLYVLLIGSTIFFASVLIFRARLLPAFRNLDRWVLLIMLIGTIFRAEPYLWITGGQDPGVYVTMSSYYGRQGSTFIRDEVREPFGEAARAEYDNNNQLAILPDPEGVFHAVEDRFEGFHTLGIYIKDLAKSEYVFQFYPLFPLLMSITSKIFGHGSGIYVLPFFGLISIPLFFLLTMKISGGSRTAGYLAAAFLALNPLHAFFSKFPVTEVITVFFSAGGFYTLISYWQGLQEDGWPRAEQLVLSSGLFSCLFFTHINGLFYIPVLYALLFAAILVSDHDKARRQLIVYSASVYISFLLSVAYGWYFSFPYFDAIYSVMFRGLLGVHWFKIITLLFILAPVPFYLGVRHRARVAPVLKAALPRILRLLPFLVGIVLLLAAVRAYGLRNEELFTYGPWFDSRTPLPRMGLRAMLFSTGAAFIEYLSPLLFIVFIFAVNSLRIRKDNPLLYGLCIFLIPMLIVRLVVAALTPYHYYYARYLLAEVIPAALLLATVYLAGLLEAGGNSRRLAAAVTAFTVIFYIFFSAVQLRGREGAGVAEALDAVREHINGRDILILIEKDQAEGAKLLTPLRYFFGLNVLNSSSENITPAILSEIVSRYNDIYMMSHHPLPQRTIGLVDTINYRRGLFEHVNRIPVAFGYADQLTLHLYKFDKNSYFNSTKRLPVRLAAQTDFYDDMTWTNGDARLDDFAYRKKRGDRYLVLRTKGWSPYAGDMEKMKLRVFANDRELTYSHSADNNYYFLLTEDPEIRSVRIVSATFVPSELGLNDDARVLGLDVDLLGIE